MAASAELGLSSDPAAVAAARQLARSWLVGDAPLVSDLELIVTELVTNATLHGQAPITLRLLSQEGGLRIEVEDGGRQMPVWVRENSQSTTGRGLLLVASLASRWGVEPVELGGKVVWAELAGTGLRRTSPVEPELDQSALASQRRAEAGSTLHRVRLGSVPTDLLVAAKAHIDGVVRELILLRDGSGSGGSSMPPEMASLVETVTVDFADARAEIKRQAHEAAARGDAYTHIELHLPASAAEAAERYLAALDRADTYARSARLLALAPPQTHVIFRRWYITSLVDQLRAANHDERIAEPPPFDSVLSAEIDRLSILAQASTRLELLQEVTARLADARDPAEMSSIVTERAVQFLGVETARVFLLTDDRMLRSVAWSGTRHDSPDRFDEFSLDADLPGAIAVRTGEPLFAESLREVFDRFPELEGYYPEGRSLHHMPLVVGGQPMGLLALTFLGGALAQDAQQALVSSLAHVLAQALKRSELAKSDEEAQQILGLLADATQIMVTAREPAEVLDRLVHLAVPRLGDWCTVYLADGEVLRRVAMAIVGEGDVSSYLNAPPLDITLDIPHTIAYRTGQAQPMADGVGRLLSSIYPGLDFSAYGGDADGASGLCAPIKLRGETIGVIGLTYLASGRRLTPRVVDAIAGLASRAAIALDNAQRLTQQEQVIQALVGALLPSHPPATPEIEFAARYLPAGGDVAGDWWEADEMADGSILIGLGDAAGHGIDAVSLMCELRHGARALATVEPSPSRLLRDLSQRLSGLDDDIATAIYGRLAPTTGRLRWASAGHVPPVLMRAGGAITVLDGFSKPPLGAPYLESTEDHDLTLGPGDTLVLYSDGVIERRRESLEDGIDGLVATIGSDPRASLEQLADLIVAVHCQAPIDDCCLLLIRRR